MGVAIEYQGRLEKELPNHEVINLQNTLEHSMSEILLVNEFVDLGLV
jgi:hypothetical protein